ncbi:hypothetical protein pb186bvf_001584 [Paramecium bursaria]
MNIIPHVCSHCKVSVGFLNCCSCKLDFNFQVLEGLSVNCPCCQEPLQTYYQQDSDLQIHKTCWKNHKRMFYSCGRCDKRFCCCVENRFKKKFCLQDTWQRKKCC